MRVRSSLRAQALLKQILHSSRFYVGSTQLVYLNYQSRIWWVRPAPQSARIVSAMRSIVESTVWAKNCALRGKYACLA